MPDTPDEGKVQCKECERWVPKSEVIYIGHVYAETGDTFVDIHPSGPYPVCRKCTNTSDGPRRIFITIAVFVAVLIALWLCSMAL